MTDTWSWREVKKSLPCSPHVTRFFVRYEYNTLDNLDSRTVSHSMASFDQYNNRWGIFSRPFIAYKATVTHWMPESDIPAPRLDSADEVC